MSLSFKTTYGHSNKRDQNRGRSNKIPTEKILT